MRITPILLSICIISLVSCKEAGKQLVTAPAVTSALDIKKTGPRALSEEFKKYWYNGEAELTSYELRQARYGNLNTGHAVLIYVTEPFRNDLQVKADNPSDEALSVLKLNATKKFLTGMYPYSIMTSTFFPVKAKGHALKVTHSAQEWCGHVYTQLNNRDGFEVQSHSYFEKEGDQEIRLEKQILEDELWTLIRLSPGELPLGEHEVIPSFDFLRLKHKEIKAYSAVLSKTETGGLTTYTLEYPELGRSLAIRYTTSFPHSIEGWTETAPEGFSSNPKILTTTATLKKRIQSPYWTMNDPEDVALREQLGL